MGWIIVGCTVVLLAAIIRSTQMIVEAIEKGGE